MASSRASLLILLIANILFGAIAFGLVWHLSTSEDILRLDVRAFHTGAQMAAHLVTTSFYDPMTQYAWQRQFFPLPDNEYLMPFVYPSAVALPSSILAPLSVAHFYQTVAASNVLVIMATFLILLRTLRILASPLLTGIACLLFFSFLPLWEAIIQIQLSPLLFLAFVGSWALRKAQHPVIAGITLALLLIRPHTLFIPVIALLWQKQWRMIGGLAIGVLIFLAACIWTSGFESVVNYPHVLLSYQSIAGMYDHPHLETTVRGLIHTITQTRSLSEILPLYLIIEAILTGVMLMTLQKKHGHNVDLQWGIVIIVTILTSPHTLFHDVLLLMFPILLVATSIFTHLPKRGVIGWQLWCVVYAFFFLEMIMGLFRSYPFVTVPLILILLIVLIKQLYATKPKHV